MPIFADYHRTVVGSHGTRRAKALEIVSGEGTFTPSKNNYDWLGHGTYFWEYAPQQAWAWAKQRHPGEEVAVLASMIRLGNCLDLLDPRNANDLTNLHDRFVADADLAQRTIPRNFNARKYLDCAVLEYVYDVYESDRQEPIDTSRAVYVPSGSDKQPRLWESSWL